MIQINLIPDVKQQYLNARRTRNITISIAIVAGVASVALVVVLALALGAQKVFEMSVDRNIDDESTKLANVDGLSDAVVLQNQLNVLPGLNDDKVVSSRLFDFLAAVNPSNENAIQFTNVTVNPEDSTVIVEGIASSYVAVDIFKKTINNTSLTYQDGGTTQETAIATAIEDGDSDLGEDGDGQQVVRFDMTITYDEHLFSNAISDVTIVSPKGEIDVTDSRSGVSDDLFGASTSTGEGN